MIVRLENVPKALKLYRELHQLVSDLVDEPDCPIEEEYRQKLVNKLLEILPVDPAMEEEG